MFKNSIFSIKKNKLKVFDIKLNDRLKKKNNKMVKFVLKFMKYKLFFKGEIKKFKNVSKTKYICFLNIKNNIHTNNKLNLLCINKKNFNKNKEIYNRSKYDTSCVDKITSLVGLKTGNTTADVSKLKKIKLQYKQQNFFLKNNNTDFKKSVNVYFTNPSYLYFLTKKITLFCKKNSVTFGLVNLILFKDPLSIETVSKSFFFWKSYKKHRLYIFYIRKVLASLDKLSFNNKSLFFNIKILIRGKIQTTGGAKKRKKTFKLGSSSFSKYTHKTESNIIDLSTPTGSIGLNIQVN